MLKEKKKFQASSSKRFQGRESFPHSPKGHYSMIDRDDTLLYRCMTSKSDNGKKREVKSNAHREEK